MMSQGAPERSILRQGPQDVLQSAAGLLGARSDAPGHHKLRQEHQSAVRVARGEWGRQE